MNYGQYEDYYRPVLEEMEEDVKKFLKKYCENVGATYLAPPPLSVSNRSTVITDKFIENVEFRRS